MEEIDYIVDMKATSLQGIYVTDDGNVYSDRTGKIIKLNARLNNSGYAVTHGKLVHRLIAEAYIPNPENKRTINHIDGNKLNNNVSNLEWATDKENITHAWKNGMYKSKLSEKDMMTIFYLKNELKWFQNDIAKHFGITQPHVSAILSKKWIRRT